MFTAAFCQQFIKEYDDDDDDDEVRVQVQVYLDLVLKYNSSTRLQVQVPSTTALNCLKLKLEVSVYLCSVGIVSSSSLAVDMRWIAAGTSYDVSSSFNFPLKTETKIDLADEEIRLKSLLPDAVSQRTVIQFFFGFLL